jgi:hypothetical protein
VKKSWIIKGTGFGMLAIGFIFLAGWLVMMLWNWLMPELFTGAREISYWEAMGVLLLSKILFGWGRGWRGHGRWNSEKHGKWREHMKARWEKMTPEQREKCKGWMNRYCRVDMSMEEEKEPEQNPAAS